jgi:hypothetical protein
MSEREKIELTEENANNSTNSITATSSAFISPESCRKGPIVVRHVTLPSGVIDIDTIYPQEPDRPTIAVQLYKFWPEPKPTVPAPPQPQ